MEFNDVIKNRYSVRKFTDEKVSQEIIDEILEMGRIATIVTPFRVCVHHSHTFCQMRQSKSGSKRCWRLAFQFYSVENSYCRKMEV